MTVDQVRDAMRRRFTARAGFALAFEVPDQSGFAGRRYIDAVVLSLWQTNGLRFHAFEIKITRGDLRRELRNLEKGKQSSRHCDTFSLVLPDDVSLSLGELPQGWGVYRVRARGKGSTPDALFPVVARSPRLAAHADPSKRQPHYDEDLNRYVYPEGTFDRSFVAAFAGAMAKGRR